MNAPDIMVPEGTKSSGSLRQQVAVGAGWMTGLQLSLKVIEIGFIAILARLLVPSDFGVIAGATIFIQFTSMLVEIGVGATLVQLRDLSREDIRVAGTLVFLNGLLYCLIAQILAPFAASFLNLPEIGPVLRVLSIVFIIQAFGVVAENLLLRKLMIKQVTISQFISRLIGTGAIGITFAWMGFGYWSLVIATISEVALKASILCFIERPPLRPLLQKAIAKRLLKRSSGFSASKLINFVALRADNAIVGRTMDASALGLYSRAYNLMSVPADLYGRIAERIIFPALARVQNDPVRLRTAYKNGVELTAVIGIPLSSLLAILAPEVIQLILGPKWTAVIVPFAVLSSASYFRLGSKISGSVQRAKGATRAMISNQLFYATLVVLGCLATYQYGIGVLARAVAVSVILSFILISISACRLVQLPIRSFVKAHLPGFFLATILSFPAYAVATFSRYRTDDPFLVIASVGSSVGCILLIIIIIHPRRILSDVGADAAKNAVDRFVRLSSMGKQRRKIDFK